MFTIVITLHVLICLVLVVIVLLQAGKGGGLASAFGGAGGTDAVFGGRGTATFLSKFTTILGTVFFITSLMLAIISTSTPSGGIIQREDGGLREPQPFNPEAQILLEEAEPPAVSEEADELEGDTQ
jgi:preprotein translocase subunit SecG